MKTHRYTVTAAVCLVFVTALFRADSVIQGATDGLLLCLQVIIPSIFPFIFLSMLLCNYWKNINIPLLRPICKATGIPENMQSILLLAAIGGYPVGAQAVSQAYSDQSITKDQAKRLLGFCNNAGPSFIFGLLSTLFDRKIIVLTLWLIHIGSALFVGILLPNKQNAKKIELDYSCRPIPEILHSSLLVTGIICGWVILFRILLHFLETMLASVLDPTVLPILFGVLELSNGCIALNMIASEATRFIVASALLSMGGLCVAMQTVSVSGRLGTGAYFPGKIMQTSLSVFLSSLISIILFHSKLSLLPVLLSVLTFVITLTVVRRKKVVALCS